MVSIELKLESVSFSAACSHRLLLGPPLTNRLTCRMQVDDGGVDGGSG